MPALCWIGSVVYSLYALLGPDDDDDDDDIISVNNDITALEIQADLLLTVDWMLKFHTERH